MERAISLLGVFALIGLGWLLSDNRKRIAWKVVLWGTVLQFVFALLVLKTDPGQALFGWFNSVMVNLLGYTKHGSDFVFGPLGDPGKMGGFVFATIVLPTIIFFSSLMSVLYYLGIMQRVVEGIAKVMVRFLGTSGAETLCAAANIFVGQTEAPLMIKPYMERLTRSEYMVVMTSGFATIAGGVMGTYAIMLSMVPDAAGHLLAASVMSAPAAILFAKLMVPETEDPVTHGVVKIETERKEANVIDAAAAGASQGLMLALNVGAMLIAFIALVHLVDGILGWAGGLAGAKEFGLDDIFKVVFAPFALLMGVPMRDAFTVGDWLGQKLVINEFFAYLSMSTRLGTAEPPVSARSAIIALYALCGFSNFSSIGIQLGGIGGLAPSRRGDMARLGLIALTAGSLACFQTAAIAGVL
ncbi:MAG: nucleoside transporter C-terminal domain-containing protein, partial [Candidatus Eremiobacterota bacterium]